MSTYMILCSPVTVEREVRKRVNYPGLDPSVSSSIHDFQRPEEANVDPPKLGRLAELAAIDVWTCTISLIRLRSAYRWRLKAFVGT